MSASLGGAAHSQAAQGLAIHRCQQPLRAGAAGLALRLDPFTDLEMGNPFPEDLFLADAGPEALHWALPCPYQGGGGNSSGMEWCGAAAGGPAGAPACATTAGLLPMHNAAPSPAAAAPTSLAAVQQPRHPGAAAAQLARAPLSEQAAGQCFHRSDLLERWWQLDAAARQPLAELPPPAAQAASAACGWAGGPPAWAAAAGWAGGPCSAPLPPLPPAAPALTMQPRTAELQPLRRQPSLLSLGAEQPAQRQLSAAGDSLHSQQPFLALVREDSGAVSQVCAAGSQGAATAGAVPAAAAQPPLAQATQPRTRLVAEAPAILPAGAPPPAQAASGLMGANVQSLLSQPAQLGKRSAEEGCGTFSTGALAPPPAVPAALPWSADDGAPPGPQVGAGCVHKAEGQPIVRASAGGQGVLACLHPAAWPAGWAEVAACAAAC